MDGGPTTGPRRGDAFGALLLACLEAGAAAGAVAEIVEREDGFVDALDAARYFAGPEAWDALDRAACDLARGRVLDVGAGAGRAALHLQAGGRDVVALDVSPGALEVCRRRGVRRTALGRLDDLARDGGGPFDAFLLLGNNLGLLAGADAAGRVLAAMAALAAPGAVVLGRGMDPYRTKNPVHRAYHDLNRARGRLPGQIRLRVRHQDIATDWFDYLFASVDELRRLVDGSPWALERCDEEGGAGYLAVLRLAG